MQRAKQSVRQFIDQQLKEYDFKLCDKPLEVSEHRIIVDLKRKEVYPWASEMLLALYQQHFLVLNSLYKLRSHYLQRYQLQMAFSPKGVSFSMASDSPGVQIEDNKNAVLEAFYCDNSNFDQASTHTVVELLASFWKMYNAQDQRGGALQVLGLDENADWQSISKRYRQLVQQCHPDRGGDTARFISIQAAYEQLKILRS